MQKLSSQPNIFLFELNKKILGYLNFSTLKTFNLKYKNFYFLLFSNLNNLKLWKIFYKRISWEFQVSRKKKRKKKEKERKEILKWNKKEKKGN